MNSKEQLLNSRENIFLLAQRHGASNIRVFGSVARGDFTETSEIDFLVDMLPGRSLLNLVGFKAG